MTQPLALIVYEKLLPGSQLANRLQDLNYRVQTLNDPSSLAQRADELKPMIVLADFGQNTATVSKAVEQLRVSPGTKHIPVLGFCPDSVAGGDRSNAWSGVTLLVGETAILSHLPQLLEQALQVE